MSITKKAILATLSTVTLLCASASAQTVGFPNKPIKLIVPFTPGAPEAVVRQVSERLARRWGQPVVVENRVGAAGNIAAVAGAKAAPDGYTLLLVTDVMMTVNPLLYKELPFDPIKDFAPVSTVIEFPSALFVSPDSGIKSLQDLVARAKAEPTKLNYGSWGIGSASHLGIEQFAALSDIKMTHVPYPGLSAVEVALKANDLQVGFAGIGSAIRGQQSGLSIPIAVAGEKRHPGLPGVPTFAEAGYPKMQGPNWWGLVVPAKTPPELIQKLSADVQTVVNEPEFKANLLRMHNYSTVGDTPAEFSERIRKTAALWTPVVGTLNIEKQ